MRQTKTLLLALMLAFMLPLCASAAQQGGTFTAGKQTFLLNGKPFTVKAAEVHYPRIPRPYWEHRIRMCKALGMNTLCIYVFWNIHEPQRDAFDFTGNNDVAAFCRLAQKHGMYVIVRPGPYVCAEWEMGGLPWWLLKKKDIRLREQDPYFMERVGRFEEKVAEQLAPLSIQHGGPIIMVQVENEYGSYGEDKPYVSAIRDMLRASWGKEMTLFQCDWASNFTRNGLDDLVWTMNFGTGANIDEQFRRLGELRPDAPKMCSEFWSGWFDKWGARHETRPADAMVGGIDEMLSKGISFSLYMTHGGTSFGHWAGANSPGYQPDVTSYDYDAPINEYGHATEKYWLLRKTLQKYSDRKLPAVPSAPAKIISVPEFSLDEYMPLLVGSDTMAMSDSPLTFEDMDMGWGTMLYTTTLPAIHGGVTLTADVHDYAIIYLDGRRIGTIDRVRNERTVALPDISEGTRLDIVVEGMGRINFGRAIKDYKGIIGDVTIASNRGLWTPRQWTCSTIPDSYETAVGALAKGCGKNVLDSKAGYYRGYFNLSRTGDTFINTEAFQKGQVYVNGHAIGRFWSIGPQQTLYVPGCWLKKGRNEVIVLDVVGPKGKPTAFCQDKPEIDKLNLEKTNKHNNPGDRPDLNSAKPAISSTLKDGNGWQRIDLPAAAKGRYIAIEVTANHDGKQPTAIAEIYARNDKNVRIDRNAWVARYADSERGNSTLDKMFDLQESTYWQTENSAALPHLVVIDMGTEQTVTAIEYLPRAEQGAPHSAKDIRVFIY